jgi:hypothetical protein
MLIVKPDHHQNDHEVMPYRPLWLGYGGGGVGLVAPPHVERAHLDRNNGQHTQRSSGDEEEWEEEEDDDDG